MRNVKFDIIKVSYTMRLLFLMFVTAVCVLFLLDPSKTEMAKNQECLIEVIMMMNYRINRSTENTNSFYSWTCYSRPFLPFKKLSC